jgi:hypothetical protein
MTPDPYDELREQLRATTAAAERLARETAGARGARTPPGGWASPEETAERQQELQALIALVEALREIVPPELVEQVRTVLRQLLLLARTLIDWWVERVDSAAAPSAAPAPTAVEQIPID